MNTSKLKLAPPRISVATVDSDEKLLTAVKDVELIVVPKVAGQRLSRYAKALDEATGGLIRREAMLVGEAGTELLIDLKSHEKKLGKVRHILVLGIGTADRYHSQTACAVVAAIMEKAVAFRSTKVALLVSPNRLTEGNMTLRAIGAVTHCRLAAFANDCKSCMPDEFRFVCSPQASRHFEAGLNVELPRCRFCTLPTF